MSPSLTSRLVELKLCSHQDLRLCRRKIKSLQKNLPIFDSTWLDALFALKRLTHFQVETIEAEGPERLIIGPYRLIERPRWEPFVEIFTARSTDRPEYTTLLRLPLLTTEHQPLCDRLAPYLQISKQRPASKASRVSAPLTSASIGGDVILTEAHHPGLTLADLLVRKGRFPVRLVEHIAASVLQALEQLHAAGLAHGDLRPQNIVLTRQGRITLRHAGITLARFPVINFHDPLSHDYFDAIPPELFLGQQIYSPASDLFALGSLCWKLLCGRPALLAVDPLMKLNRFQRNGLPDVTDHNPDVTAPLVELIRRTTSIDPQQRLQSPGEALAIVKRSRARVRSSAVARFVSTIPSSLAPRAGLSRSPLVFGYRHGLAAATLLVGAGLLAWDQTQSPLVPLDLSHWLTSQTTAHAAPLLTANASDLVRASVALADPALFPVPDASNVIHLTPGHVYAAMPVQSDRALTFRSPDAGQPAVVTLSGSSPWTIAAPELTLANVIVRFRPGSEATPIPSEPPASLLSVTAQNLHLQNCQLEGPAHSATGITHAITWRMDDLHDQSGGYCHLTDCAVSTPGSAVVISHHFGRLSFENTLHHGRGALVQMAGPILPSRGLTIHLAHSTLRSAGCLLRLDQLSPRELQGLVQIELQDSVIDLASGQGAMFLLTASESPAELLNLIRVSGRGSVLTTHTPLAVWFNSSSRQLERLPEETLHIEGLMTTGYAFAQPQALSKADSALKSLEGPRLGDSLPGIFPAPTSGIQPASYEFER